MEQLQEIPKTSFQPELLGLDEIDDQIALLRDKIHRVDGEHRSEAEIRQLSDQRHQLYMRRYQLMTGHPAPEIAQ